MGNGNKGLVDEFSKLHEEHKVLKNDYRIHLSWHEKKIQRKLEGNKWLRWIPEIISVGVAVVALIISLGGWEHE